MPENEQKQAEVDMKEADRLRDEVVRRMVSAPPKLKHDDITEIAGQKKKSIDPKV